MYENGQGVVQDYVEAAKWFRKGAEQGDSKALHGLGVNNDQGLGLSQDYVEAVNWYRKAAELGNAKAQYNLGLK